MFNPRSGACSPWWRRSLARQRLATGVTSVTNLSANFQILMPGEVAPAHRHSMAALRFVMQGEGATTTVDGQVCQMAPGDMVLTPAWRWHEHACAGSGDKPVIWFDLLDAPLIKQLDVVEFERPDGPLNTPNSD